MPAAPISTSPPARAALRRKTTSALAAALLLLVACGDGGGAAAPDAGVAARDAGVAAPDATRTPLDAGPRVSFEEVEIIFNAACTESGCHGPTGAGGLVLHAKSFEALVGVAARGCPDRKRVVPGDPRRSVLVGKLTGADLCGGKRMPLGCDGTAARPCLPAEDLATIEAWIAQGAPRE